MLGLKRITLKVRVDRSAGNRQLPTPTAGSNVDIPREVVGADGMPNTHHETPPRSLHGAFRLSVPSVGTSEVGSGSRGGDRVDLLVELYRGDGQSVSFPWP